MKFMGEDIDENGLIPVINIDNKYVKCTYYQDGTGEITVSTDTISPFTSGLIDVYIENQGRYIDHLKELRLMKKAIDTSIKQIERKVRYLNSRNESNNIMQIFEYEWTREYGKFGLIGVEDFIPGNELPIFMHRALAWEDGEVTHIRSKSIFPAWMVHVDCFGIDCLRSDLRELYK